MEEADVKLHSSANILVVLLVCLVSSIAPRKRQALANEVSLSDWDAILGRHRSFASDARRKSNAYR
ncbi:hypothetical protein CY34DRAFT_802127 [Suillus luteus UH-Slu-Lm8-n1]|uniref:Uncharacterized protein n=1 Tax=Suillus luteus UH-Slu-Lm8-n1 TaxID=930992 RepID=A0A0C9Z4S5_9AGAM|nr:hypothetical protein CY34DRAFT_814282 [Suillus luteus UH-Slu-Lm8-n1]KIK45030.1 hypothetical protein CY34DRAFT_802127 [Suillus luteus UH-Slu-Lm8-n1]